MARYGANDQQQQASPLSGAAILNAICKDPAVLAALADELASAMLERGFAQVLIQATERIVAQQQRSGPGRLLAGTVAAIQARVVGVSPAIAMVKIGGALTATPAYVPSHLLADIAVNQEVWVEPVNGRSDDLMVVAIRNFK